MTAKTEDILWNEAQRFRSCEKRKNTLKGFWLKKIGISANHLSRLERGVFQPSIEVVKRLAHELEVSADSLLTGKDETAPDVSIKNKELSEKIRLIDQLEPEDQQAITRVIDSMFTKCRMQKLLSVSSAES